MNECTESEALNEWGECMIEEYECEHSEKSRAPDLSNLTRNATQLYNDNKRAKIGTQIKCPTCGTMFKKKVKGHTFCNTKKRRTICKDTYHNSVDEVRRNRANIYTGYRK